MSNKEFIRKLRRARQLLQKGWIKNDWAKDKDGSSVHERSRHAVCWCLMGALHRAGLEPLQYVMVNRYNQDMNVAVWNDSWRRTKEQVLACIDNSIAALKKAA